ncbi:MAG: hypothetical protein FIA96_15125 [Betaproteobacteria bacterium]|nr:hypothetical protein [Betaproteobacteria bacterium]
MNIKHITAATILSLAMASAFAGDWYVVGSVGQAKAQDSGASDIDRELIAAGVTGLASSVDDTDTGYKLQVGYNFTKNWGIEGGYVDLGEMTYKATGRIGAVAASAKARAEVTGWNIAGVGTLPINEQFSLFGKLGAIYADVDVKATATGGGISASDHASTTDWKANFGVGATYKFNKQWGMRAEWERFDNLGDNNTGKTDVDLLSVGVVFSF